MMMNNPVVLLLLKEIIRVELLEEATAADIRRGLDPAIKTRSRGIIPKPKWSDVGHPGYTIYHFSVPGRHGETYLVKVKAVLPKNGRSLSKADLQLSCSCNFWKFQGPEYHAKVGNFLYGPPRGTVARPDVMDPMGTKKTCKHVAAVLNIVEKWLAPSTTKSTVATNNKAPVLLPQQQQPAKPTPPTTTPPSEAIEEPTTLPAAV